MPIRQLMVSGARNLAPLSIDVHESVNFIYGDNGSGKTSLLESVAVLANAKSFRTNSIKNVICSGSDRLETKVVLTDPSGVDATIACLRTRSGDTLLKLNGSVLTSQSDASRLLPVQVIDPTTFRLLSGSPEDRRNFIDWGVFHVEHNFIDTWKKFKSLLKQRNTALKERNEEWLSIWTEGLVEAAIEIDKVRTNYLEQFVPVFDRYLVEMDAKLEVTIGYQSGWDRKHSLAEIFARQAEKDMKLGYTQSGPHRAELQFKVDNISAVERLSRGQQKIVVAALKLAQGSLYKNTSNNSPIYLIDDLASELDEKHRFALCRLLEDLNCQAFITSIERDQLCSVWKPEQCKVFHVEHGKLFEDKT